MSAKKAAVVYSMTGFGRGCAEEKGVEYDITLRSVNSRYLDIQFRAPRTFGVFEADVRELLQTELHRGRVEVLVDRRLTERAEALDIEVQQPLIQGLMQALSSSLEAVGGDAEQAKERLFLEILSRFDVVRIPDDADESEKTLVLTAAKEALAQLVRMRKKEGQALYKDITGRLHDIDSLRSLIEKERESVVQGLETKIAERMQELLAEASLDPSRLLQEAAYHADRSDIAEELVRLQSHLLQAASIFDTRPSGRKFEFLLQEIGRELNTIGSKAQHASVQHYIVEAKSHMEKCREQIMNVE